MTAALRGALLVGALAVGTLAGCADGSVEAGTVVPGAEPAEVSGTPLWVQLPTGRLDVVVGEPLDRIPAEDTDQGEALEADEGRTYVPLELDYRDLEGIPFAAPQDPAVDPAVLTTLALVLGDDRVTVPFGDGTSYVEVPAGERPTALEATFDGVRQSVSIDGKRDPGEAAGLYDGVSTRVALRSCGDRSSAAPAGVQAPTVRTCRYDLWEYPYVEGLGWAASQDAGSTWVVATAQTWLAADQMTARDGTTCRVASQDGEVAVRVDGADATAPLDVVANVRAGGFGLGSRGAYLLPSAAEHELDVQSSWTCRIGDEVATSEHRDEVTVSNGA